MVKNINELKLKMLAERERDRERERFVIDNNPKREKKREKKT